MQSEVECILAFLQAHGQFTRFLPRLRDRARARDAALAEARVAFFLFRNGFRIVEWEPPASDGYVGEFAIQWNDGPVILVEVKAPGWQGELSDAERTGERKRLGSRACDPLQQPIRVIEKNVLPKLSAEQPSLVVIADDLFISPIDTPHLDHRIDTVFGKPGSRVLAGILFFKAEPYRNEIEYIIRFHANPCAAKGCQIPEDVRAGLIASSEADETRRLRRRNRC